MKKLLATLVFLLIFPACRAQVINAASCSQSAVQTAFSAVTSSTTTVNIPACSGGVAWTTQVTLTVPSGSTTLSVLGAGSLTTTGGGDQTVIEDGYASSNALLLIDTGSTTTSHFRLAGITFEGGSGGSGNPKYDGMVQFSGLSQNVRTDHIHVNTTTYTSSTSSSGVQYEGCLYGVVDHSIFDNPASSVNNSLRMYNAGTCDSDSLGVGDESWAHSTSLGTVGFMFAENNVFNSGAADDCTFGGRFVFRFNTFNSTSPAPTLQTHPTGGAGRIRGCRAWEVYQNQFDAVSANYVSTAFFLSSGTGVVWGNTLPSSSAGGGTGFGSLINLHSMRRDNSTYSQTATPNGWGYCGTSFNGTGSNWDHNTNTSTGYRCFDQPGQGISDMLTGGFSSDGSGSNNVENTTTGCTSSSACAWPQNALEPVYEWMDAYSAVPSNPSVVYSLYNTDAFTNNVDYYAWCSASSLSGCTSFTGATGTGSGVLASMPSTCTTGVAYWATDQGSWNESGSGGQGELYKCTSTNTWTLSYTPYTYPHPLDTSSSGPTVILNEASTYPATRMGINFGGSDPYGDILFSNILGFNASLQPTGIRQQVTAASGSTTTVVDANSYDGLALNQMVGGTIRVLCHGSQEVGGIQSCLGGAGPSVNSVIPGTSGSVGCEATVTANTAAVGGVSGSTITFTPACSSAIAAEDQVLLIGPVVPTTSGNFTTSNFWWSPNGSGTTSIDSTSGDLPSGTPYQVIKLDTSASSGLNSGIQAYYDSGNQSYWFNGSYTFGLMAKVVSGSGLTLTFTGARVDSDGAHWSTTVTPSSGSWTSLTSTFSVSSPESATSKPAETTSDPVQVGISLSGQGTVLIAAPSMVSAADIGNGTNYMSSTLSKIEYLDPGECRYWAGQNGTTLDDLVAPLSQQAFGEVYGANFGFTQQGIVGFLNGALAAGCESVTMVAPITWQWDLEAGELSDCINGTSGTTYGAKCIASGRPSGGFASLFKEIDIDYGNEVWNPSAGNEAMVLYSGGSNSYWNYIPLVVQWCGAIKQKASWAGNMKCGATMWTDVSNTSQWLAAADPSGYVDLSEINGYTQFTINNTTGVNQFISALTEPWQNVYDSSSQYGFYQSVNCGAGCKTASVYEFNNSTNAGSITQAQTVGYPEGQAYGLVNILQPMLNQQVFGAKVNNNNFFTLFQNNTGINTSGGATSLQEWGIYTGSGAQWNNPRPTAEAMHMYNTCVGTGDTGYQVTTSGVPTYSFSGYNGVNAESSVPYLEFAAYKTGTTRCIVVVNVDTANPYTFTVSGTNPPLGTVTQVLYTSTNMTDSNEAANSSPIVQLATSTLTNPTSFTVPAHSAMSISYSTGTSINPPINVQGQVLFQGLETIQ